MLQQIQKRYYLVAITLVVVWLLAPIYQFIAHKGKLPMLPIGFIEIPSTSPVDSELFDPQYQEAEVKALDLLSAHKTEIKAPAISAAVSIDGKLVWSGAVGWSDIGAEIPVTTQTQFRIGSTSKALTSAGLARMVDKGAIDLDKAIESYFSDLPNKEWKAITSRQLISHTAGLAHYSENTDYIGLYETLLLNQDYQDVSDSLSVFDGSTLLFSPGSKFHYSSLGTVLLSAVMQAESSTPFAELMKQTVFMPAGMTSTQTESRAQASNQLARFYFNKNGTSNRVREWREVNLSHRLAGGGFVSTSKDLVKLGAAFMDEDFLSAETRTTFWTPHKLPNGDMSGDSNQYALGWRVSRYQWQEESGIYMNHGGVSRGAQSWLMVLPDKNMAVAVNINANTQEFWDFASVSMDIAKAFTAKFNEEEVNK